MGLKGIFKWWFCKSKLHNEQHFQPGCYNCPTNRWFLVKMSKNGPNFGILLKFSRCIEADPRGQIFKIYTDSLRGGGGLRSIFTFLLFLIEEDGSYQELFSEWKNYVPSQTYIVISRKSTLKSIFSYSFWDKCFELGSYALFIELIVDLGLRSENIEF